MRIPYVVSAALVALAIGVAGVPLAAQDFDKGLAAYRSGDFATALAEWRPLAEQGNWAAQFNLGFMHAKGQGVRQNDALAARWYKSAAEQGYSVAQYALAQRYQSGQGVRQDYAEAARWYRFAAEQGHTDAQIHLAVLYASGDGVPFNLVYAHMWMSIAASLGDRRIRGWIDDFAELMTPEEIATAERLARECVAKDYKGC